MIKLKHREPFIMAKREKKPVHKEIMTEINCFVRGGLYEATDQCNRSGL